MILIGHGNAEPQWLLKAGEKFKMSAFSQATRLSLICLFMEMMDSFRAWPR